MLPKEDTYREWLRFICQTADDDDPSLPFMVSLWAYCLKNNGLTDKQIKAFRPYLERAREAAVEMKRSFDDYEAAANAGFPASNKEKTIN